MKNLVFLLEEPSARDLFEQVVPRIIRPNIRQMRTAEHRPAVPAARSLERQPWCGPRASRIDEQPDACVGIDWRDGVTVDLYGGEPPLARAAHDDVDDATDHG